MNNDERLVVNRHLIGEDGLELEGELPCEVLDLPDTDACRPVGPLLYAVRLSMLRGDLLVEGRASAAFRCPCDRCGRTFEFEATCPNVCHFFENYTEDLVDLTDDIREDVLVAMPQKLLCSEDCPGRCPSCGKLLADGPCDCTSDEETPSAWSELDKLDL